MAEDRAVGEAHRARAHGDTEEKQTKPAGMDTGKGAGVSAWGSQRLVLGRPHPGAGLVRGGEGESPDGVPGGWDVALAPAWPGVFQALPSGLQFLSSVQ